MAALLAVGAIHVAGAQALELDVPKADEDSPVTLAISGVAQTQTSLFVYVEADFGSCGFTAAGQELTSGPPVLTGQVGPGTFEVSARFTPTGVGRMRVCGYLSSTKPSSPIDTLDDTFFVASGKAYTPKLRKPGTGTLSYERFPVFTWDKGRGKDLLQIYKGPRSRRGAEVARLRAPSGRGAGFRLGSVAGRWRASNARTVGYGTYSWTVTRTDPRIGTKRASPTRRFRVGPSPLKQLVVKLRTRHRNSIKRPGTSIVTVKSAPEARIQMRLTRQGHVVSKRSFRESRFSPRSTFTFPWRCSSTGSFKLKVSARDRYGNHRRRTVRWTVSQSRCAELKRKAEERRRAKEKRQSGGESGGSCTPGYSPCLPPASDYDCAGGSGDGPEYVSGPVYVTGSDPYGLDSDGDGIGCE